MTATSQRHTTPAAIRTWLTSRLSEIGWNDRQERYLAELEAVELDLSKQRPALSVVVISWRYNPDIATNLAELARQARDVGGEIIFVDNGSEPGSMDPVRPHADSWIRLKRNTGAYLSRNIGTLAARGDVLVFVDDDGLVEPHFLAEHLRAHRHFDVVSVRGVVRPRTASPLNQLAKHYDKGARPFPVFSDVEGNVSYRAGTFFAAGGWDDDIIYGGGGFELAIRLAKVESDLRKQMYTPGPVLLHDYVQSEEHLAKKREKQEASRARLRQKHPDYDPFMQAWAPLKGKTELLQRRDDVPPPTVPGSSPAISVLIPVHNRADYLRVALRSLQQQQSPADEIIVVDDGSSEDIGAVCQEFPNLPLRYIRKPNSGAPATRNRALREATGDYILWLDSDDALLPHAIACHRERIAEYPDGDVFYGDLVICDQDLSPQRMLTYGDWYGRNGELIASLFLRNSVPNPGTVVRRTCFDRFGGMDETFRRAHDYDWWARVAPDLVHKHVGRELLLWRWHDSNMSSGSVSFDKSFDARIARRMLRRHDLSVLFPTLPWDKNSVQATQIALLQVAQRFISLGWPDEAERYLGTLEQMDIDAQIHDLIRRLRAHSMAHTRQQRAAAPV